MVVGKVAGDAVSVVGAVEAVVGTLIAAHGLHVHQVTRLALTFTSASETEIESRGANRADRSVEKP